MRTNIFRSAYEQPENKLTYCFLSLLEHLDFALAVQIIAGSGISAEAFEQLQVDLLYGGKEANPDGSLKLEGQQTTLTIYFENKTWRRKLDIEQIRRHIRVHMNDSPDCRLLVITTDKDHAHELAALGDCRICFMTWHQVAEAAERLSHEAQESKDRLLLSEFCEYLEMSGEAWRAEMPDSKLIEANAQYLAVQQDRNRFLRECFRLMDAVREDINHSFEAEISTAQTRDKEGLVCNECDLRSAPFGQWLSFGVYYDPQDHKIDFKTRFQAEFAVFFDFDRKKRESLSRLPDIERAISTLRGQGFEFNFPENKCGNAFRVCYWREPMSRYDHATLDDLRRMFEAQLRTLFASDFYRLAATKTK